MKNVKTTKTKTKPKVWLRMERDGKSVAFTNSLSRSTDPEVYDSRRGKWSITREGSGSQTVVIRSPMGRTLRQETAEGFLTLPSEGASSLPRTRPLTYNQVEDINFVLEGRFLLPAVLAVPSAILASVGPFIAVDYGNIGATVNWVQKMLAGVLSFKLNFPMNQTFSFSIVKKSILTSWSYFKDASLLCKLPLSLVLFPWAIFAIGSSAFANAILSSENYDDFLGAIIFGGGFIVTVLQRTYGVTNTSNTTAKKWLGTSSEHKAQAEEKTKHGLGANIFIYAAKTLFMLTHLLELWFYANKAAKGFNHVSHTVCPTEDCFTLPLEILFLFCVSAAVNIPFFQIAGFSAPEDFLKFFQLSRKLHRLTYPPGRGWRREDYRSAIKRAWSYWRPIFVLTMGTATTNGLAKAMFNLIDKGAIDNFYKLSDGARTYTAGTCSVLSSHYFTWVNLGPYLRREIPTLEYRIDKSEQDKFPLEIELPPMSTPEATPVKTPTVETLEEPIFLTNVMIKSHSFGKSTFNFEPNFVERDLNYPEYIDSGNDRDESKLEFYDSSKQLRLPPASQSSISVVGAFTYVCSFFTCCRRRSRSSQQERHEIEAILERADSDSPRNWDLNVS